MQYYLVISSVKWPFQMVEMNTKVYLVSLDLEVYTFFFF